MKVTASSDGVIDGAGRAWLVGRLVCDFPNAQIQAKMLDMGVRGRASGQHLVLTLRADLVSPATSRDYGGFMATVLRRAVTLSLGTRKLRRSMRDSTGKGSYLSETTFTLVCTEGCT